ncbi:MAG: class I SAM-dependent methyltransferase [Steroidobacteraceae bacterium]|nr:class I SAM-dependent methyltransferase [Steroidobacteraceae bacterium]MDW8259675.1 class I SAM-dependent methyltransferase [Gammaproteobacteria bacterium]
MVANPSYIGNIEEHFRPTHDERARQKFASVIRKNAIIDLRQAMEADWKQRVEPALRARGVTVGHWRDIQAAMENRASYRFYSAIRYNAQEMCYLSVQPTVERALPRMIQTAREARRARAAGGSLRLNPQLELPRYLTALDTHLAPGWTHSEFTVDDVAQGAVVEFGGKVFTGLHPYRHFRGVVAQSIGEWLKRAYPAFKPRRMLDIGTTSGNNLFPYLSIYPGIEAHGVDAAAPVLRFGHAVAERAGLTVHFSQQNAEAMDFPDGHFDLIVSSFFFHEIPLKATQRVLRECRRLLAPGGHMVHMELPNEAAVDAYANFFWNWDTANNNEPFYTNFREQDPVELCVAAGFHRQKCFAHLIPDFASFGEQKFSAWLRGEVAAPNHGAGGWFVFGVHDA